MYFPATTVRERLLTAGTYLASVKGFARATVPNSAAEIKISLSEAYALFPTHELFERELLRYIQSRMQSFVSYDPTADHLDRLCSIAEGTFHFAEMEKHCFHALVKGPWPERTNPFEVLVDAAMADCHHPLGEYKRTSFISLTIGFAHLAAFGRVRLLLPMVKRQLLRGIIRMVRAAFHTAEIENSGPHSPQSIPPVAVAEFDAKGRLFRAGIEEYWNEGPEGLTLEAAVKRAGFDSRALTLFDGDVAFIRELEDFIDSRVKNTLQTEVRALPENSSYSTKMKALAIGYVNYGVYDPKALCTLLFVASGSIVPSPMEDEFRGYDAYSYLLRIVENAIIEHGGDANQWLLFEQTIAAWSLGHGAALLVTQSFWKNIAEDIRWKYLSGAMECIFGSLGPEYFEGGQC